MHSISLFHLFLGFIPSLFVLLYLLKFTELAQNASYAMLRMLIQLSLIGYILSSIFLSHHLWPVLLVISIMLISATWIALGNSAVSPYRTSLFFYAFIAIFISALINLFVIIFAVLELSPWYEAKVLIPIAGMIFAASMNSVSLSAERLISEYQRDFDYQQAERAALKAALIPVLNGLFAVGLVSLPGMMTGQILSGISPLIAARYQIMIMFILFSSAGISAIFFLHLAKKPVAKIKK
jgi:putative ABC transport system permease protein